MCYFFQVTYLHFNKRQFKGGCFNCGGRWMGTHFELRWIWESKLHPLILFPEVGSPSLRSPKMRMASLDCVASLCWGECWTPRVMMDETSVPRWAITNNSLLQNGLPLISPGAPGLMWHSAISWILRCTLKACITFYRARKPELQKTMAI